MAVYFRRKENTNVYLYMLQNYSIPQREGRARSKGKSVGPTLRKLRRCGS